MSPLIAVPPRTALDWLRSSCEVLGDQFHFTPVTAMEVQKSLEALNSKKATGLDDKTFENRGFCNIRQLVLFTEFFSPQ